MDPFAILTATEFAAALAALTRRQVRGLADRSGVARSTISGWTTGQHLPNPNQIDQLRRLLTAVGVDETGQNAWADAVLRVRQVPGQRGPDRTRTAPYLGLEPFAEADAERFFGREDVVSALVDQVQVVRADRAADHRFVFLVGASGEGKSSILRAGVAVALAGQPDVTVSIVAPASDEPAVLAGLGADHVVIVDQFEQIFTAGRAELLEALIAASAADEGPTIVAGVRSDFYPRLVEIEAFNASLVAHQVVLSPMSHEGMRRAIVEPARRAGVDIEPGLVEMMLNDVAPATSLDDRPNAGILPLLSHALLETWARGSGRVLRVADYVSLGGLNGALEKTAEVAFGRLDPLGAEAAGDLFRRLVNIDADGLITRRHAGLDEIADADGGEGVLTSVMWHFVDARLLTVEAATLTLSHEVLLRAWSRLRTWVADDRDGIRLHRELAAAAGAWAEAGDDDGGLLAGGRLDRARTWLESPVGSRLAGPSERRFIAASEERARRRAEQDRRRVRRAVALASATSVLAIVATIATVDARDSRRAEQEARLGAEVTDLANRSSAADDPYLAAFYALEATQWTDEPLLAAQTAWLDASRRIGNQALLRSGFDLDLPAADLGFNPDGSLLAILGGDGTVHLIDPTTRETVARSEPADSASALAWSPDARRIVTADRDGGIRVFDTEALSSPVVTTDVAETTANDVAWSPDGSTIAVTTNGGPLLLLDASTLEPRGEPIPTGDGAAQKAAWSPDGERIATTNFSGDVSVFDHATQELVASTDLAGDVVGNGLSWNAAGTVIAVTSSDGTARYFDSTTLDQLGPPVTTGTSFAHDIIWSPDGNQLAGINYDGTVKLFMAVNHEPASEPSLTGAGATIAVSWSSAAPLIVTANEAGNVRFFDVPEFGAPSRIYGGRAALHPAGTTLVTTNFDDTIRIYDPATLASVGEPLPAGGTDLTAIAWNADGTSLAAGSAAGGVSLLDGAQPSSVIATAAGGTGPVTWIGWAVGEDGPTVITTGGDRATVRSATALEVLHEVALDAPIVHAALDPEGTRLATAGADGTVSFFDPADLSREGEPVRTGSTETTGVSFSPDGEQVATVNADGTLQIVDASGGGIRATFALEGLPTRVAWSPSGDVVAVGSSDGAMWLFSAPSLELIGNASVTGSAVASLFWTADGSALVSSHENGYTHRTTVWTTFAACEALRAVLPADEMDRLIDIPDAASRCQTGAVEDVARLPAAPARLP